MTGFWLQSLQKVLPCVKKFGFAVPNYPLEKSSLFKYSETIARAHA